MKKNIEELLAAGELRKAIQLFRESVEPTNQSMLAALLQQAAILSNIEEEKRDGILSFDEFGRGKAKVSAAILQLLRDWNPADDLTGLAKIIDQFRFSPEADFGPLFLVNCDRQPPVHRFSKKFKEKKAGKARFQFYFIAGCPDQMPDSLAERLIFQIIDELQAKDSDDDKKLFDYQTKDGRRLKIAPAPIGSDKEASINKFKARVQERFQFSRTESFEAFIETGIPKINYDFVATAWTLHEKDWFWDEPDQPSELFGFIQWMIDVFQSPHPDVPTFLFFFVAKIPNLHLPEANSPARLRILDELSRLSEKNASVLLTEIGPVETDDVKAWLDKIGIDQPKEQEKIITEIAKTLSEPERLFFRHDQKLPMKDVQEMQKIVYDKAQKSTEP